MREPRVGDIRMCRYVEAEYEIVGEDFDGYLRIRFNPAVEGTSPFRSLDLADDTLVSYMPDPANPQVGDQFEYEDGVYVVTSLEGDYGGKTVNLLYLSGKEKGNTFCWTIGSQDEPLRTVVKPADPVDTRAAERFKVTVGAKTALTQWPPAEYVEVEWVGDKAFAGVKHNGLDDGQRKTYTDSPAGAWKPWTAPVEPVERKWELTTIDGPTRPGVAYVGNFDTSHPFLAVESTDRSLKPLVRPIPTAVVPLDPPKPPRIKTVWRVPKPGEQFLDNAGSLLTANTESWIVKVGEPRRVLVAE